MIVEELSTARGPEWDAWVDAHPAANVYHLRAWTEVAVRAYGMRAPLLVARPHAGGPIVGALPLFVVGNRLRRYVTNGLFGAYGPILATAPGVEHALLDRALAVGREAGAGYLQLKTLGVEPPPGFVRRARCVIATLPLAPDEDSLWKSVRGKVKRDVKTAQRSGLIARSGWGELGNFYDVLAENMHRLGTPIYGRPFVRELVAALGPRADVVTLALDGRTVSGALAIHYRGATTVPFASSRADAFKLCPNNLLYWEIMKRAVARGSTVLDFGRSPLDSGSLDFKLRWGAVATPQPFDLAAVRGAAPALDPYTPGVRHLARLWQRLPRPVADALGPTLCGQFLA